MQQNIITTGTCSGKISLSCSTSFRRSRTNTRSEKFLLYDPGAASSFHCVRYGCWGGEGSFYFPPRINLPNFLFIPSSSAAIHPHHHHLFDRSARSTATNNYRITNNNLLCQKREGVQNPRMRRAMTRGFPPSLRQLEVK